MKAIELLDKFAQNEGCGNWFTLVCNYHPSVVESVAIASVNEALQNNSKVIYLITNETDMTVESAWFNFEESKKECKKWETMKPQKRFMVVELPIS